MARGINVKFGAAPFTLYAAAGKVYTALPSPQLTSNIPVGAFDFYIATNGVDTNPGTQTSPWAISSLFNPDIPGLQNGNIQSNRAKMAGKRIGFLPGTYNLTSYAPGNTFNIASTGFATPLIVGPPGTAASPTILKSTLPLGAIIVGCTDTTNPNASEMMGTRNRTSEQYLTIDGFELTSHNAQLISTGGSNGAGVTPTAQGIVVQNCYLHNVNNSSVNGGNTTAITVFASIGAIIRNNFITNVNNAQNRTTGVEWWSSRNCLLEYNTIIVSQTSTLGFYAKNTKNSSHTVRYNYIDLSGSPQPQGSIFLDLDNSAPSALSQVYNNVCLGAGIAAGGTGLVVSNSVEPKQIFNNTVVCTTNATTQPVPIEFQSGAATLTVYNNICTQPGPGYRGVVNYNFNSLSLSDYNMYSSLVLSLQTNGSDTAVPSNFTTLASWQSNVPAACIGKDAHSITAGQATYVGGTPTFPAQKYQLTGGSLGKNTGSTNGQTSGTAMDMGAWAGTDVNTGAPIAQIGCNHAHTPNV